MSSFFNLTVKTKQNNSIDKKNNVNNVNLICDDLNDLNINKFKPNPSTTLINKSKLTPERFNLALEDLKKVSQVIINYIKNNNIIKITKIPIDSCFPNGEIKDSLYSINIINLRKIEIYILKYRNRIYAIEQNYYNNRLKLLCRFKVSDDIKETRQIIKNIFESVNLHAKLCIQSTQINKTTKKIMV
jgi:hypothetical protein